MVSPAAEVVDSMAVGVGVTDSRVVEVATDSPAEAVGEGVAVVEAGTIFSRGIEDRNLVSAKIRSWNLIFFFNLFSFCILIRNY